MGAESAGELAGEFEGEVAGAEKESSMAEAGRRTPLLLKTFDSGLSKCVLGGEVMIREADAGKGELKSRPGEGLRRKSAAACVLSGWPLLSSLLLSAISNGNGSSTTSPWIDLALILLPSPSSSEVGSSRIDGGRRRGRWAARAAGESRIGDIDGEAHCSFGMDAMCHGKGKGTTMRSCGKKEWRCDGRRGRRKKRC